LRYFDTSVVFSLYLNGAHTTHADAELRNNPADVILSRWVDVELKSAIGLSVRRQNLTLSAAERAFNRYRLDRAQGKYLMQATVHFTINERDTRTL
jgi:predicted nucleic acid-binding protein